MACLPAFPPARRRRPIFRSVFIALFTLLTAACALPDAAPPPFCRMPGPDAETVYIVSHGWHTEVGIPAANLRGPLAVYRTLLPGARVVMFGYGKRTFMTAPPEAFSEYILGPLPGAAVIQVTGLSVLPTEAYRPGETIALSLSADGSAALSDFIWNDLDRDRAGRPRLIGPGPFPGSLFYAARSRYDLFHTCNTWTIDALAAGGLPTSGDSVVFSGQAMARAETVAMEQCEAAGSASAALHGTAERNEGPL